MNSHTATIKRQKTMKHQPYGRVLVMAAIWATLAGCGGEKKEEAGADPESKTGAAHLVELSAASATEAGITVTIAEMRPLAGIMEVPAKLLPNQDLEAHVGSFVQGRVRKVFANVGDVVREGQELLEVEGLEVGQIKASFIKAKAQMDYAEANYQRMKTLLEQKVGSQKAFLESQAEFDKARAEFSAEDKRIHSIGLTDADLLKFVVPGATEKEGHIRDVLPIRAPIAGTIVERNIVIGQLVDASTLAFKIVNASTLWAEGQVHESALSMLIGKPDVAFTATAFPGEEFPGKVIYIAPVVDERSRTITIRAAIPNRAGRLKPQMFGELRVPTGGEAKGILVPAESVQKEQEVTSVFVALNDSTFERRTITLGASFAPMVEVREGLRPGEKIVTKGAFQLKSESRKHDLEGE